MPFVAAVAFIMYQKVHLLLYDIAVVAARVMKGVWEVRECTEFCSSFQNYTTVISSQKFMQIAV